MSNQVLFRYRKEGLDADITAAWKILAASAIDQNHLLFRYRKDGLDADITAARKILASSASYYNE